MTAGSPQTATTLTVLGFRMVSASAGAAGAARELRALCGFIHKVPPEELSTAILRIG